MLLHRPLLTPPRLRFGDTVGLVAPGSPPPDPRAATRAVAALKKLGFNPRLARHARQRLGFLAGSDAERAADLMEMFTDPAVKAIFCLRGGYGTGRLLNLLDYAAIRRHPKILIGYSDITALHCALLNHACLVVFHGPMMTDGLGARAFPKFTLDSLFRTVMEPAPAGDICEGYDRAAIQVLQSGRATGPLIGGNLSLLCATLATPFQPDFRGAILFFEDVGEAPYRVDRMLTHLLNAGLLQQVAGVAVGLNADCHDKATGGKKQTLSEVLSERLGQVKVPVLIGLPFGHVPRNATLPIGLSSTLDTGLRSLMVNQPAVQ